MRALPPQAAPNGRLLCDHHPGHSEPSRDGSGGVGGDGGDGGGGSGFGCGVCFK